MEMFIDGQTYHSVKIGKQIWMIENLNVSHYRNGDPIPNVTNNDSWINLTTGAFCYFDNNAENGEKYGKLYNWYAVNDSRSIAPKGWHIPNKTEWDELSDYAAHHAGISISEAKALASSTTWETYNDKIFISHQDEYVGYNLSLNNSSGFSALPGGIRHYKDGGTLGFYFSGRVGYWWSTTEKNTLNAWWIYITNSREYVTKTGGPKYEGLSVRCIRDSN